MRATGPARRLIIELLLMSALGIVAGYLGPFGTFALPLGGRIAVWLLLGLVGYGLYRPVAVVARLWRPTPGIGHALLAAALMLVPTVPMTALVCWILPVFDAARPPGLARFAQIYGQTWVMGALVYAVFVLIHQARAPVDPPPLPEQQPLDPALPALHRRLPPGFGPVIALKAEDHYVRVYGEARSVLLLMRLADAIDEIAGIEGIATHRSWWVARTASARIERRGRGAILHLPGDLAVPVARDRLAAVRALGASG